MGLWLIFSMFTQMVKHNLLTESPSLLSFFKVHCLKSRSFAVRHEIAQCESSNFVLSEVALAIFQLLLLLLSHVSRARLCATPQTAAHQAPPALGVSRQEHWSGVPLPSPMHESEKGK